MKPSAPPKGSCGVAPFARSLFSLAAWAAAENAVPAYGGGGGRGLPPTASFAWRQGGRVEHPQQQEQKQEQFERRRHMGERGAEGGGARARNTHAAWRMCTVAANNKQKRGTYAPWGRMMQGNNAQGSRLPFIETSTCRILCFQNGTRRRPAAIFKSGRNRGEGSVP